MPIYSIYVITNLIDGLVYVGYTHNPNQRWSRHKTLHKDSKKSWLYAAMRKHGVDNFSFEVIYQSHDKLHTKNVMEAYFINEYRSFVKFADCRGYNGTLGGDGGPGVTSAQATKHNQKRVLDGTHIFLSNHARQIASITAHNTNATRLDQGTHLFLDRDWNRANQLKLVAAGIHPFQCDGEEKSKRNKALSGREIVKTLNTLCKQNGVSAKNNHMRPDEWILAKIDELSSLPSASQAR